MESDRGRQAMLWAVGLAAALFLFVFVAPRAPRVSAQETFYQRRARIERLDPAAKAELRRAQRQFASLNPEEQQRLRDLHDQIEVHDDRDELLEMMERYCDWLKTLSPTERADLRELPPEERIEKIKALRAEQSRRRRFGPPGLRGPFWGGRYRKLSVEEREGLMRWLDGYLGRHAAELIDALPERQKAKLREDWRRVQGDPKRRRILFVELWALWHAAHPGERLPLGDEAFGELVSQLSPEARQWLGQIRPEARRHVLGGLIGAFLFIHNHEPLSAYLQKEASAREREFLTSLPPDEMRHQLWLRYLHWKWPDVLPDPSDFRRGRGWPRRPMSRDRDGAPGPRRRFDRDEPGPPHHRGERPEPPPEPHTPPPE